MEQHNTNDTFSFVKKEKEDRQIDLSEFEHSYQNKTVDSCDNQGCDSSYSSIQNLPRSSCHNGFTSRHKCKCAEVRCVILVSNSKANLCGGSPKLGSCHRVKSSLFETRQTEVGTRDQYVPG